MRYTAEMYPSSELKTLVDAAQREPVFIERERRDVAVLMSAAEYDQLRSAANAEFQAFCDGVSDAAMAKGLTENELAELTGRA